MQAIRVERQIGGRTFAIETGTYAKLSDGAVTVHYGDSVVFGAVVRAPRARGSTSSPSRSIIASAAPRLVSSPAAS